jgi:hypothetical protein
MALEVETLKANKSTAQLMATKSPRVVERLEAKSAIKHKVAVVKNVPNAS